MRGFEIYGKHLTKDFDCYVDEYDTSPPAPVQVNVEIPFMQGSYDFSNLFGESIYKDRILKYYVDVIGNTSTDLNILKIKLENWLLGKEMDILKDDALIGWYYLAKCIEIKENDEAEYTRLELTFNAYPFKIKSENEGDKIWDTFCFETDTMQEVSFLVAGVKEIKLYNNGSRIVVPEINSESEFTIEKGTTIYNLSKGRYKDGKFILEKGENKLIVKGNGKIEFIFKIEVI